MRYPKYVKAWSIVMMLLPWLLIPLLGKSAFKRFFPSGIFISFVVLFVNWIARKRRWWKWYDAFSPKITWVIPFTWGPFLIGAMWILKLTYGNFLRYIALNIIIDGMFTYGLGYYLKRFKIFSLLRLTKNQLMSLFMIDALILYGFHYLKEKVQ
ncbi:hypothetical protein [Mangrovibacillus cuniculi]|uniref:hypothetical protein n=1 Tax=Mangrovibacillus cuniculi TaxID=2593652 RepID=UPI001EFA144E|nr:hypothetical protein [Mangrovibacillus cuniculi]